MPLEPRGMFDGKPWVGKIPPRRRIKDLVAEEALEFKRPEGIVPFSDVSWTLPGSAANTLRKAYEEAIKLPEGTLQRALIIDQAIRKVRRDYSSSFKFDPNFSGCKR